MVVISLKNLDYGVDYESIRIKLWLTNCDSYLFYNIKQPARHYTVVYYYLLGIKILHVELAFVYQEWDQLRENSTPAKVMEVVTKHLYDLLYLYSV